MLRKIKSGVVCVIANWLNTGARSRRFSAMNSSAGRNSVRTVLQVITNRTVSLLIRKHGVVLAVFMN
jgi:hypothetical protein